MRGQWRRAGTGGSPGLGPASLCPHGGGPVTHRGASVAGRSLGRRRQLSPLPGPFRRRCGPAPAPLSLRQRRGGPDGQSRSSARLPPCEVSRPPCRAPGPPCRSGEDAAGKAPHLAGLLGAGEGVPSLCRLEEVIFLAEIYMTTFFFPSPFRQCLALLGALALTLSVEAEPQYLGENTLSSGYFGLFLGFGFCGFKKKKNKRLFCWGFLGG